jgi:transcriptional regulator with XRE-family HTH domain
MATRERALDRGRDQGRLRIAELGREIRQGRRAHGLSLTEVGRASQLSSAAVSRIERGMVPGVPLMRLAELLAVVGMELSARAFPGGGPVRDAVHARLLERLRARVASTLRWLAEVPVAGPGDSRAWDATIRGTDFVIGVEAETRVRDLQALDRRIALKRRDGHVDSVVLLLANTRSNRMVVREFSDVLRVNFPLASAPMLAALASGRNPGASGIVLL